MHLALSIEAELNKLKSHIEDAHIFHMSARDDDNPQNFPGFMGKHKNRKITLDFVPWEEKKIFCVIYLTACFPLEISITQRADAAQDRFIRGRLPFSTVELKDKEFLQHWVVESYNAPLVKSFLDDKKNLKLIKDLGEFEKLTIDLKYLKFSKLLNYESGIKAEELLKILKSLDKLASKCEVSCKI